MGAIERFSTASVRFDQRLEFWNRLTGETYPGTTVDQRHETFDAEMLRWTLGDLVMMRPRADATVVTRRPISSEPERIVLHLHHRGRAQYDQIGRVAEVAAGDLMLCSTWSQYRLDVADHECLIVEMSRAALEQRIAGLDDVIGRRIPGSTPGSRILHNFFLSLWQQGDLSEVESGWQYGAADVLLDLVGLAVRGMQMPVTGPRELRERAIRFVEAHLGDPDLGTNQIAAELGVSVRTVQNIFAAMGTTPGGHILARRLGKASEVLVANPQASITEIAFELGFSESSYFARCFRQQFGTSPSKWRVNH